MAGAPTKGFPVSLPSIPFHALRSGVETLKQFRNRSTGSAASDASQLQRIAGLRRGTATRQAAFRAARRRDRSRRSKVAASAVPLLVLGSACVPAIAFATTGGAPSRPAPGSVVRSAARDLGSFAKARPFGGDWSSQPTATSPTVAAPAAPHAAPSRPAPAATGTAVVVSAQGRYIGTFVVTCYDLGGHTATGAAPTTQTVAVDPRVIPLGTRIYIAGVGERIAQDPGGAIKGDRLDIWEPTYSQCAQWGVRDRQVWIG